MPEANSCFVIAPIGDEGTDIRNRSDQIFRHIISPIAKECGYEAVRSDQISKPGIITRQIIEHLINDPLVIADLAGQNPNVFYELAIRHAVRKPVVQLGKVGERLPFDVAQSRTIELDLGNLDSVEECKRKLREQIRAVEKDPSAVDNPISNAIDLQALQKSGKPMEKSHAEIMASLQDLKTTVLGTIKETRASETTRLFGIGTGSTNPLIEIKPLPPIRWEDLLVKPFSSETKEKQSEKKQGNASGSS